MRKYRRLRAFLGISVAPTAVPPDKQVSQSPIPVFLQHEHPLAEGAWNLSKNDTGICGIGTLALPTRLPLFALNLSASLVLSPCFGRAGRTETERERQKD